MSRNSIDREYELIRAAREAIQVSERLMAQINAESGCKSAPGPVWAPAFNRLKAALAEYTDASPQSSANI